jgi:hypothetical protein
VSIISTMRQRQGRVGSGDAGSGPSALRLVAHFDLGLAVWVACKSHFVPRQFRQTGQARADFCEWILSRHRPENGVPQVGGLVI